uniref:Uncharacterized protein n=1 Tax=Arundo donax TaxID=35708 RepID=A0A0A9D429_ARUDO
MEDHHGSHPLLHGGGHHHLQPPAAALAYAWDYPSDAPLDEHAGGDDQLDCCFSTALELRRALVRALAELNAARAAYQAELRCAESEAARLAALVASAAAERDELRRHCHSLLLLLHHQSQAAPPPPSLQAGAMAAGGGAPGAAVMDEHAPDDAADDTELEMALARQLPEKGRLVEAVVLAGPLLQTLLLAGPLPRWRHPPPPAPAGGADIPPFNPGRLSPLKADASNSFSSGSAGSSSPESNCSGGPPPPVAQQALSAFHMSPFCM